MTALPEGWQLRVLGELATTQPGSITDGPFGSKLTSAHYSSAGARVIRLQNIGDGVFKAADAFIPLDYFEGLRRHEVQPGDLLVASLGDDPPRSCLAPADLGPAIVKADCIRVRLSEDVDHAWVAYAMRSPAVKKFAKSQMHGVGRLRLGLKAIRAIPIPVPPVTEQRRIVELLDDLFSRLDAADTYLTASLNRLSILRLARIREIRHGLRSSGTPMRKIGTLGETSLGKMLDSKKAVGDPTPYLRNINVRWGSFDLSDIKSVPLGVDERERFTLLPGDLLVCEGGEPGRCAVWPGSDELMTFQKALHRVRVDTALARPEFVAAMLELVIAEPGAQRLFTGTTIKHLPQERLRQIDLPVPAVADQERVQSELGEIRSEVDRLTDALEIARSRSMALRRELLDAAFSGQLTRRTGDRDGNDQSWRPVDIDALILHRGTEPADFDQPWFDATERERADSSAAFQTM